MGLDSFWVIEEEKIMGPHLEGQEPEEVKFEPHLNLCGGLYSEHGQRSFRGKVYNYFFEDRFGVSLYRELISNDEVRKISEMLDNVDIRTLGNGERMWFHDMRRMFKKYSKAGYSLLGWW
jgi:hypothetical protein